MIISSTQFRNITKLALKTIESVSERVFRAIFGVSSFLGIEALGFVAINSRVACKLQALVSAFDPSLSKAVNQQQCIFKYCWCFGKTSHQWLCLTIDKFSSKANQVVSKKNLNRFILVIIRTFLYLE